MMPAVSRLLAVAVSGLVAASFGACTKSEPAPAPPSEPPAAVKDTPAPKVSDPACVGREANGPEEKFEIGGKTWVKKGSTLTLEGTDPDDEFAIGQISDIKDHTPENAANLKLAMEWLQKEKVDAIAVTGDLGESAESIQRVLEDAAAIGVPVFAIIGNRECKDHYVQGVTQAQAKFKNVFNLNEIRVVNTDDASIVSMPGYYNKSYIHCADGCEYTPDDTAQLGAFAKAATGPVRVLISHGPPLQAGPQAIDRIHEGANVGDPALATAMKGGDFAFGLFGNIQEAGGYATDLAGATRVEPETWADALYLNPGPIDSVRWVMLDGTESVGMAGLLKIKGKQGMYKIFRVKPGEAKPAAP